MDTVSNQSQADLSLVRKRALLAELLQKKARQPKQVPLSFAQQRLWFLHQLAPDSPFYNISRSITLHGHLQKAALEQSLNELVRRHEALRTRFATIEGHPVQVIEPALYVPLSVEDLTALSDSQREAVVYHLAHEEARRPFDLAKGPLIRTCLLYLSEQEHVLLLTMHHIISDGWSMGVLFRELGILYDAFSSNRSPVLPELPIQYADYTLWQREWFTGEVQLAQLAYWKKQLANLPQLELPTDRPRPAVQTFEGAYEPFHLPLSITTQLKALSQREGLTLFIVLLAGFDILLARYSGQQDIVIGTGIANRTRRELEGLIGFFVNTVVLRSDLSGDPTVRAVLQRVREVALQGYAHQDLPFEQLVEEFHPHRDLGHNPLFQVIIGLQNAPQRPLELAGLTLQLSPVHNGTTKFDLHLSLWEDINGLEGLLEYSTDLFDTATIRRMLGHYRQVLSAMILQPEQKISMLPLLTDTEQVGIQQWNATEADYPAVGLHRIVEQQVKRTPDAVALCFHDGSLTYAELNRRANQLARYLCRAGAQAGDLVGLSMERSSHLILSMLAILKAGGAYVPLDMTYPHERITFMIEDTHMRVLLTWDIADKQRFAQNVRTICLGSEQEQIDNESEDDLDQDLPSPALAYVIYTSGSTGIPKGAAIPHHAVTRLIINTNYIQITETDKIAQASNASFDAATFEVWGALSHGAQLIGVTRDIALSPITFAAYLREQGISVLFLTTALFNQIVQEVPDAFASLRVLLFGGEAVTPRWVRTALNEGKPQHLLHVYGPTENTTFSSWYRVNNVPTEATTLPIGYPIANTQMYILDMHMQPVPIGISGELYLGGDGLAWGYLQRPDVTAERFLPDPLSQKASARLYKTGDCARWLSGGEIEFLRRLDTQVKLRGFRVELGEIETMLNHCPGVREAVVALREDEPEQKRLVAYVVADTEALKNQGQEQEEATPREHVTYWQMIFDERIYGQAAAPLDPTFHIAGWNSRITNQPIPAQDMQIWLDDTIQAIKALQPRRVLEIGCGTGLLLFRLAPYCQHYHGTDISATSLTYLRDQLSRPEYHMPQVTLSQRSADDLSDLAEGSFDTIILNSVVQYFPDVGYLVRVLEGALRLLAPGGAIFIGDVRSLPLLEVFHTLVEIEQAPASLPAYRLRQRIEQRIRNEEELVIDPAFFTHLSQRYPTISSTRVMPKRGRYTNELSQFRYQVILHTGEPDTTALQVEWLDWHAAGMNRQRLRELLEQQSPAALGLARVPNARLAELLTLKTLLHDELQDMSVGQLRDRARQMPVDGVEPEDFWELVTHLPADSTYRIALSWARHKHDGSYDVLFYRHTSRNDEKEESELFISSAFPIDEQHHHSWSDYANWPPQASLSQTLPQQLRAYLQQRLPDYMVPASFVLLEQLPLTPNGKVDRRALPAPDTARPELEESYVAPRNPIEELLAGIWSAVLGLEQVGIQDNFFDLGGHSLLATQIIVRIREAFQQDIPLRSLFENPTVEGLAAALQNREANDSTNLPPLLPQPRPINLPLSYAQERLWFLTQLEVDMPFYTMAAPLILRGPLDITALQQSLNELVRRHEALRTRFMVIEGSPVQVIEDHLVVLLPVEELSIQSADGQEEVRRLAREEARRPFDLVHGPLIRARLLRLEMQEHVLLLSMHHIISDGWSLGVFFRELSTLYNAFSTGKLSPLPDLSIQYADYTLWQREWLATSFLQQQVAYWQQQLANLPQLALPTDHPRPAVQRFRGHYLRFTLPYELSENLRKFSQHEEVTLFMTLLAGFQVLLGRYSGQVDLAVGTPIANRARSELEGLVGLFVNTLVLRANLKGNPSVHELLGRVRQTALEAYAHQDLPFEKLVEALNPERDLSTNPLFQVMFALQNAPYSLPELSEMTVSPLDVEYSTARFDLMLNIYDTSHELWGGIEYNSDLFEEATIKRLLGHYQQLLAAMIAQPKQRIAALPILTEAELLQLQTWRSGNRVYPQEQCIQELFEAQVAQTADAIALVWQDTQLTYQTLDEWANRLAHYLQRAGIEPEVRVGICLNRTPILAIALLGILKSGGAYVPLDPNYPGERLSFMLEDAGVALLLTEQSLLDRLPIGTERTICLDKQWQGIAGESTKRPITNATKQHVAYVIYTSGSTGRAKGIAIEHCSGVTLLHWAHETFSSADLSGTLMATSICFDLSVFEFFAPLSWGGRVLICENALHLPTTYPSHNVTLLNTVPSAATELVRMQGIPATVSTVNLAGEPIAPALIQQLYQSSSIQRVFNLYGPSEDTTYSTAALLRPQGDHLPPIGYPIANTRVYVLDTHMQPVPVGIPGELYIGGDGLARGYWQRPELTAERFVPDPFTGTRFIASGSSEPGKRLYRTGDLVRYRADGSLEFLGRIDRQVKLRGFRIELGEIEAVLQEHPLVQEAVVLQREDTSGEKYLVAYVVATQETPVATDLQRFLHTKLPEYMSPSLYVFLEALPLNANGKIDHHALPYPSHERSSRHDTYVAPTTPVEESLATLWTNVLGIVQPGIHDDFFAVGGHSLLVTRLISQIEHTFHCQISIREIFEAPTIARQATLIARKYAEQAEGEELAGLLAELEGLSDEEVQAQLTTDLVQHEERFPL